MFVVYQKIPNKFNRNGKQVFKKIGGKYTGTPYAAARKAFIRKHVQNITDETNGFKVFYLKRTGTDQFYEFMGKDGAILKDPIRRYRPDGSFWTIRSDKPEIFCMQIIRGGSERTFT